MTIDRPQILVYASESVNCTPSDVKWLPASNKFVFTGQLPTGGSIIQVYEVTAKGLNLLSKVTNYPLTKNHRLKMPALSSVPLLEPPL
jgi:hypothetical protein